MTTWLDLSQSEWIALVLICFGAGLVRGFAGFALSALVMAVAVTFLAPIELIPILWFLEMAASVLMARGGWRDADRKSVITLVLGNWAGWPVGLWLTMSISVATSKTTVLIVLIVLAASQLARIKLPFLATTSGTALTGFVAGIVSGMAHIGGMVVALYALARQADAHIMRGTLVTYLFIGSIGSFLVQLGFGVMEQTAALRGLVLVPPTILGVWLGTKLFTEKLKPYYRPFCLWLLIGLAALSLLRQFS